MTTLAAPASDEDIAWISDTLGLAPLDGPRRSFLDASTSIDVSACPGSGKTTLVVAKLGLLAKSWRPRSQGICVLSHTNVARTEIQDRLVGTVVGGELLRYPHYIDTIHGFINRFLSVPWLKSNGHHVVAIDDDIVASVRRKFLGEARFRTLEGFLARKGKSVAGLRLATTDFESPLGDDFPAGPDTKMYQLATAAVSNSAERGFFRHDEMFIFAQALLSEQPEVAYSLRARFPYVLIDEMQDTTVEQTTLLNQIFPIDDTAICVQRVGDPNQAIFEGTRTPDAATFPIEGNTITLANSFRFDQTIADLAHGFANHPVQPSGLLGLRDTSNDACPAAHTVFIFDADRAEHVFDAYASHVIATFPDDVLRRGKVTAVGFVHKPVDATIVAGHSHFPKTISHYWADYEHKARRTNHFTSLLQYVRDARSTIRSGGSTAAAVNTFATGVLKLANTVSPAKELQIRSRPHRLLLRLLDGAPPEHKPSYSDFIVRYVLAVEPIDEEVWTSLALSLVAIAGAAGGGDEATAETTRFTAWSSLADNDESQLAENDLPATPNVRRTEVDGRYVDLFVRSIHAVKGETHLATLVVETYANAHFFKMLMPWLSGAKKHGSTSLNGAQRDRLFAAYVAATRASHLLCLAIPASSIGGGKKLEDAERAFNRAGWAVVRV